jgi:hypothetical protein
MYQMSKLALSFLLVNVKTESEAEFMIASPYNLLQTPSKTVNLQQNVILRSFSL